MTCPRWRCSRPRICRSRSHRTRRGSAITPPHRGRVVGRRPVALRLRRLFGPRRNPDPALARGRPRADGMAAGGAARIADLQPMPGGGVAFAAEDPAIGVLDAPGEARVLQRPGACRVPGARTGAVQGVARRRSVQFALAPDGARLARFWLFARELLPGAAAGADLAGRSPSRAYVRARRLAGLASPAMNGVRLELDDYEIARTYAVDPDHATLVLGTEWALRAYDRDATLRWRAEVPGVVRSVVVTPNGQAVVATLSDGTIRWHRMEDGAEFLALFPHAAGRGMDRVEPPRATTSRRTPATTTSAGTSTAARTAAPTSIGPCSSSACSTGPTSSTRASAAAAAPRDGPARRALAAVRRRPARRRSRRRA